MRTSYSLLRVHPPVLLLAALLCAWHESQVRSAAFHVHRWRDTLRALQEALVPHESAALLAWLAVSALALATAGHLIGVSSQALLRLASLLWSRLASGKSWGFEAAMSDDLRRKVWREHFGASGRPIRDHGSAVVAAFDHARLDPGLRDWIENRWTAFHSHAGSALAVMLSMCIVPSASWRPGASWWIGTGLLVTVLVVAARFAYRDVRRMNDLLADTLPDWAAARAPQGRMHELEPVRQRLQQAARSWNPRH